MNSFVLNECNLSVKKLTRRPKDRNDITRINRRYDWVVKWTATDMNYLKNCIFIDESAFDINMIPGYGRSVRGTPAIGITPLTRAESHSIIAATSTVGVINIDVRVAQTRKRVKVVDARKRKVANPKTNNRKSGTKTGHYIEFEGYFESIR